MPSVACSAARRSISGAYRFDIGQSVRTKKKTIAFAFGSSKGFTTRPFRSNAATSGGGRMDAGPVSQPVSQMLASESKNHSAMFILRIIQTKTRLEAER